MLTAFLVVFGLVRPFGNHSFHVRIFHDKLGERIDEILASFVRPEFLELLKVEGVPRHDQMRLAELDEIHVTDFVAGLFEFLSPADGAVIFIGVRPEKLAYLAIGMLDFRFIFVFLRC